MVIVSLGFHRLEVREEKSDTVFEVISGASFPNPKYAPPFDRGPFRFFWGHNTKILRSRQFHLIFQVIVASDFVSAGFVFLFLVIERVHLALSASDIYRQAGGKGSFFKN